MSLLFASLCFGLFCAGIVSGYSSKNYALHFQSQGVSDYANIWGMRSLTQFTVCLWMKSSATNYGTPFSYAVTGEDNELLLYNYKDFHVYINGGNRRVGISANDGKWHHICVSWKSSTGALKAYKDGVLKHNSINFQRGDTIKKGGSLVLGQEQDGLQSGFTSSQSFQGTMTNVNVWSFVLSSFSIKLQSKSLFCMLGTGNVYRWADFKVGVKGKTAVVIPSPCRRPLLIG